VENPIASQLLKTTITESFSVGGSAIFLIDPEINCEVTYGEFQKIVLSLAQELEDRGVQRGDRVAVLMPNCIEVVSLYFSCLFVSAIFIPINSGMQENEISQLVLRAEPRMLIYSSAFTRFVESLSFETKKPALWCIDPIEDPASKTHLFDSICKKKKGGPLVSRLENINLEDVFCVTFTSGTTGVPKGIAHTVRSLLSAAVAFNSSMLIGVTSRYLHILPMSYMAGILNTIICPFVAGASLVLYRTFDAKFAREIWDVVKGNKINTLWITPTILASILKLDRSTTGEQYCRSVNMTICVGTAPLTVQIKKEFEERYGVTISESYGLSEVLFVTTSPPDMLQEPSSAGKILDSIIWKLVDENSDLADPLSGELLLKSPYVMFGILEVDSCQIRPVNADSWFATGDLAEVDKKNNLFIVGRKKDLIIRGGINVSPKLIEDVILSNELVEQVAVVGVPHDILGEEVAAAIVVKPEANYERGELIRHLKQSCRQHLSPGNIPARFEIFDSLPSGGAAGKILKSEVRKIVQESQNDGERVV